MENNHSQPGKEIRHPPRPDQMMDKDAFIKTKRELTPENLESATRLIKIAIKLTQPQKPDEKTGFKTVYLITKKITGTNILNRKVDPNGEKFIVMIRDFNKPRSDNTDGLFISYKKVGINRKSINSDSWTLPRSHLLANNQYLSSLKGKGEDWSLIDELVNELETNFKFNKKSMFTEKDIYEKN